MTVTASLASRTKYRNESGDVFCIAEPGTVTLGIAALKSQAEIEDCIDALRQAAKEAGLPALRPQHADKTQAS